MAGFRSAKLRVDGALAALFADAAPANGKPSAPVKHDRAIRLAWLTSMISKLGTMGVQVLCVPLVYGALGQAGYAIFAAVTSSAALLAILNLGLGGAIVTPMARAAAIGDRNQETHLFWAGVAPLLVVSLAAILFIAPALLFLPPQKIIGEAARVDIPQMREALILAATLTLLIIPTSMAANLRQAYQEMHLSNIAAAAANLFLCGALVAVASWGPGMALFIGCYMGIPLVGSVANFVSLLVSRQYLLGGWKKYRMRDSIALAGDGLRYLAAAMSYFLVYQWPVYLLARERPAGESAAFAISMQLVLLPIALTVSLVQPYWGAIAQASASGQAEWLRTQRRSLRLWVAGGSLVLGLVIAVAATDIAQTWLHASIAFPASQQALMGTYLALAGWEYINFVLAMAARHLRPACNAVFYRSLAFAIGAPALVSLGGAVAVWLGLCASILIWTAWRLPVICSRRERYDA